MSVGSDSDGPIYFDTGAIAKRYLNEPYAEELEVLLAQVGEAIISSLTITEMRCLLGRHRREKHFDTPVEVQVYAAFKQDIQDGYLKIVEWNESFFSTATRLIETMPNVALRTLDALHLACAHAHGLRSIATADAVMRGAAHAMDFSVHFFGTQAVKD